MANDKLCRCTECGTYSDNKLKGKPFCSTGAAKEPAVETPREENGCECQMCPIRKEGDFGGIHFCMGDEASEIKHTGEMIIDLGLSPANAGIKVIDLTKKQES